MRRILLLVAAASIGACSVFGGKDAPSVAAPDDEVADGGLDGALDGSAKPPPDDDGFNIDTAPSVTPIVQGVSTKLKVTITRGKNFTGAVDVKTRNLRDGITSTPLVIKGSEGELEIAVPAAAPQGAADGVIEGAAGSKRATTALKTFVRGKPGDLDTTYGVGGIAGNLFGAGSEAFLIDMVLAPDDSLYLVASCASLSLKACVAHINPDGTPDVAYGTNGVAEVAFNPRGAALQPDGKLLVVGGRSPELAGLARLQTSGAPDTTFGNGAFGAGTTKLTTGGLAGSESRGSNAVAVRSDGDIFLTWDNYDPSVSAIKNGVMRLDPQGNLRTAFGASGTARNAIGLSTALTVRNNAASTSKGNLVWMWAGMGNLPDVIGIMQVDGNTSTQDPAFGPSLKTAPIPGARREGTGFPRSDGAGLIELADESIITAIDGNGGVYLRKFTPAGNGDAAFGTGGTAGPFFTNGDTTGMAAQADGKFLIAIQHLGGQEAIRFTADGKIDSAFGQGGRITKVVGTDSFGREIAVQKSGRILLSSRSSEPANDQSLIAYWP